MSVIATKIKYKIKNLKKEYIMVKRYWCISRPPTYANVKDGWINSQVWMPAKSVVWGRAQIKFYALGWVEYEQLSIEDIRKWELLPEDTIEWSEMIFTLEAERNNVTVESLKSDYLSYSIEELKEMIPDSIIEAAIYLKENTKNTD
jgi:hypothetical protein